MFENAVFFYVHLIFATIRIVTDLVVLSMVAHLSDFLHLLVDNQHDFPVLFVYIVPQSSWEISCCAYSRLTVYASQYVPYCSGVMLNNSSLY